MEAPLRMNHLDECNKIWRDTLAWIDRGTIGMKFALINTWFKTLADAQLRQRTWRLGELHICKRTDGTGAMIETTEDGINFTQLPLTTTPLMDSIVGFKSLSIWYIDEQVITFLHNIRRLFSNITLEFSIRLTEYHSWKAMAQHIWPLVQNGVSMLNVRKSDLLLLHKHVSPTVLLDCVNLHRIYTTVLPECPLNVGGERNHQSAGHFLFIWLHSPRVDGRPVVLKLVKWKQGWDQFVEEVSQSFVDAVCAVNYFVFFHLPFIFGGDHCIFNDSTGERLSFTTKDVTSEQDMVTIATLMRAPANIGEQLLTTWIKSAKERVCNVVHIGFNDTDIGPMPPSDAAAKTSSCTAPMCHSV